MSLKEKIEEANERLMRFAYERPNAALQVQVTGWGQVLTGYKAEIIKAAMNDVFGPENWGYESGWDEHGPWAEAWFTLDGVQYGPGKRQYGNLIGGKTVNVIASMSWAISKALSQWGVGQEAYLGLIKIPADAIHAAKEGKPVDLTGTKIKRAPDLNSPDWAPKKRVKEDYADVEPDVLVEEQEQPSRRRPVAPEDIAKRAPREARETRRETPAEPARVVDAAQFDDHEQAIHMVYDYFYTWAENAMRAAGKDPDPKSSVFQGVHRLCMNSVVSSICQRLKLKPESKRSSVIPSEAYQIMSMPVGTEIVKLSTLTTDELQQVWDAIHENESVRRIERNGDH